MSHLEDKLGSRGVRLEPRGAVLTANTAAMTRTTRNTSDELSWDEDQKCFSYVIVGIGDRFIEVECTKQDVNSLSEIQFECDDRGSLGWRTDACGFGHWSDHWGGPV